MLRLYRKDWQALMPIKLGFFAKEQLERLRDYPVTAPEMAELVRLKFAEGHHIGSQRRGAQRAWTYHITPAGRAWLENCRPIEGE